MCIYVTELVVEYTFNLIQLGYKRTRSVLSCWGPLATSSICNEKRPGYNE